MNEVTGEPVGHLADISTTGFKLDCKTPLPPDTNLKMRIEQIGDIANKSYMVFIARSRWCKRDEYDVSRYNVGFQLVNISQTDYDIFVKMFESYGEPNDPNLDNVTTTYA
jgi:hypothetical protein